MFGLDDVKIVFKKHILSEVTYVIKIVVIALIKDFEISIKDISSKISSRCRLKSTKNIFFPTNNV